MTEVFNVRDNALVDGQPDLAPPSLPLSPSYVETYLRNRTRPPFRLHARAPYGLFDLFIHDNLPAPTTAQELADHVSLFPTPATNVFFPPTVDGLSSHVDHMVRFITNTLKGGSKVEFEKLAHTFHTLASLARHDFGCGIIVNALSTRGEKPAAVDRIQAWARQLRIAAGDDADDLAESGVTWRTLAEGLSSALIDALIGLPPPSLGEGRVQLLPVGVDNPGAIDAPVHDILVHFPTLSVDIIKAALKENGDDVQHTLDRLREGWRPLVTIGYRGAGKRIRNTARPIDNLQSFGGATDVDWIKRRVAADVAREAMEAEAEEQNMANAETQSVDIVNEYRGESSSKETGLDKLLLEGTSGIRGIYDDEPDENVLEGEALLIKNSFGEESSSGDEYDNRAGPSTIASGRGSYSGGSRGRGLGNGRRPWKGGGSQRGANASSSVSSGGPSFGPESGRKEAATGNSGGDFGETRGRGHSQGRPRGSNRGGSRGGSRGGRGRGGFQNRRDRAAHKQSRGMS